MNILKLIFALLIAISFKAFSCELVNPIRHVNPDGTQGGFVSRGAKVAATVYVGPNARVCDRAWADGNARILDYATIKEDAWIREYSVIKDRATVAGKAVVWGTRNTPAEVREDSKIYGEAKILTGTKVSGRAEVYGGVSLKDSNISGTAKVCEGYILNYQNVDDDYFCPEVEVLSRAKIDLISYKDNAFNKLSERIIFEIKDYHFSLDKNVYQIFINGHQVDPSNINVGHTRLYVNSSTLLVEGENEIKFLGRDEFNKSLSQSNFSFLVGSGSRSILVQQQDGAAEPIIKTFAAFIYEGKRYQGFSRYKNGEVIVEGIPESLSEVGLEIKGIGTKSLFAESFSNLNAVPVSIYATPIPLYKNSYLDFSQGISGWSISHPESVQIINEGTVTKVSLSPNETERVEFSKTVRVSEDKKGFGVKFNINSNVLRIYDGSEKVQIILASSADGKLEVFDYTLGQMKLFEKKDGQTELTVQIPKNSSANSEYTVLIRLFPSGAANLSQESWMEVLGIEISKIYIDFKPMNFFPHNVAADTSIPLTNPPGGPDCNERLYDVGTNAKLTKLEEDLPFFSGGPTPMMSIFNENRIYGKLTIIGVPKSKILSLKLIGEQQGIQKFAVNLAKCSLEKLSTNVPGSSQGEILNISHGSNLVNHLFSVSALELNNVNTTIGSGESLIGAEISLRIKAEFQDVFNPVTLYSNPHVKKVLSSPQLSFEYTYKPNENLENYDSSGFDMVRTGGDKWLQPAYGPALSSIMNLYHAPGAPGWLVNDLSKLNGGKFPGHTVTHDSGLDADVIFSQIGDVSFDFSQSYSKSQWKILLDKLEDFLDGNRAYNGYVTDYNLSVDEIPSAESFIKSRLKNRCLGDRFVSLTNEKRTGSLVRNVPNHTDHFHIRFNQLNAAGNATNVSRTHPTDRTYQLPNDADLDDFWFSLDSDGKNLKIEPREEVANDFTNRVILWRFQDREGFDDSDLVAEYDQWPSEKTEKVVQSMRKPSVHQEDVLRLIYITIGNKKSGWCVERQVEIDPTLLTQKRGEPLKWSYMKDSSGYRPIFQ
jgi:murein endopeptidase